MERTLDQIVAGSAPGGSLAAAYVNCLDADLGPAVAAHAGPPFAYTEAAAPPASAAEWKTLLGAVGAAATKPHADMEAFRSSLPVGARDRAAELYAAIPVLHMVVPDGNHAGHTFVDESVAEHLYAHRDAPSFSDRVELHIGQLARSIGAPSWTAALSARPTIERLPSRRPPNDAHRAPELDAVPEPIGAPASVHAHPDVIEDFRAAVQLPVSAPRPLVAAVLAAQYIPGARQTAAYAVAASRFGARVGAPAEDCPFVTRGIDAYRAAHPALSVGCWRQVLGEMNPRVAVANPTALVKLVNDRIKAPAPLAVGTQVKAALFATQPNATPLLHDLLGPATEDELHARSSIRRTIASGRLGTAKDIYAQLALPALIDN